MSMIEKCTVCDRPAENQYAPSARCERCSEPCPTCGGNVANCRHPLPERIEERPLGEGWNRWAA